MSKSAESGTTKSSFQLDEYRGKFPEIPEQDLLRIFQEYASDQESCERVLQEESRKCLYGSSPTPDPPSPIKLLTGGRNKTDGISSFDLPRSNSTGSAGSSHSSGRSTPVNPIPTPYMVPPRYPVATTSVPVVGPAPFPSATLPPGTVCINGNLYQPVTSAGHMPYPTHTPGNQVLSTSQSQRTSPSSAVNKTSPNSTYPIYNTNGYFATNPNTPMNQSNPSNTSRNQSKVSSQTMGPGVSFPTGYYSPATQTQGYPTPFSDPRYRTSPGNVAGSVISTPNIPTSMNSTPVNATVSTNRQVQAPSAMSRNEERRSNISPNQVQVDPRFSTNPVANSGGPFEPLFVSTSPNMNSPNIGRKFSKSGPQELQKALSTMAVGSVQNVANDDYLRACYSRQQKRFLNLQKEYNIEKESLEIVIKEIAERDGALYDMKYIVEPNPTDEQLERLSAENDKIKRVISEISKNIDRLENGQAFLPPADPRLHNTHRLPSDQRHRDPMYDRSNSVPCLHQDPGRGHPPPLSRPLSEYDMNHVVKYERGRVKYEVKPSHDTTLPGWNFVNPEVPEQQPANSDEETQWSCTRCTFLNHDSLSVCEMCSSSRHPLVCGFDMPNKE